MRHNMFAGKLDIVRLYGGATYLRSSASAQICPVAMHLAALDGPRSDSPNKMDHGVRLVDTDGVDVLAISLELQLILTTI
jgi:hypothetical protein